MHANIMSNNQPFPRECKLQKKEKNFSMHYLLQLFKLKTAIVLNANKRKNEIPV